MTVQERDTAAPLPMSTEALFDPSIHQKELLQAWRTFIETGTVDSAVVPPHIASSWEKSYRKNVDPFGCICSDADDPEIFAARIFDRQYLLYLAEPFMERIYASLDPERYLVVLYDAAGYHLLRKGRIADFERISGFHLESGVCFEEERIGTCGFSLVKSMRKPVSIAGCEHYASYLHRIVGSYAPIYCPLHGNFLGALGIAGAATMPRDDTLVTVAAAAMAMEDQIRAARSRQAVVTDELMQTIIENLLIGVFFTDGGGRIAEMNRYAKDVFGLSAEDVRGRFAAEAIPSPAIRELFARVRKGREREKQKITFHTRGKNYCACAQWIGKNDGAEGGVLCQIRSANEFSHALADPADRPRLPMGSSSGTVRAREDLHGKATFDDIVGLSPRMSEIKNLVRWATRSQANVIIEGESGTGKEVFAHVIHNESARKSSPFVVINCTAIPSQLMESILFGHEKGSFTGAIQTRVGKFELADGGTVFLDEIGEMPLDMQAKLLRVLEERTIERIGGRRPIPVDIRIIAATNRQLAWEVRANRFRDDLFYRLNVLRIVLPPLRDRKDEIYHLVPCFIRKIAPMFDKRVEEISKSYYAALLDYSWPGNIRELRNAVEYSLAILDGPVLQQEHIQGFFRQEALETSLRTVEPVAVSAFPHRRRNIEEGALEAIRTAIEDAKGNKLRAAKNLSISRATLYRYLKKLS